METESAAQSPSHFKSPSFPLAFSCYSVHVYIVDESRGVCVCLCARARVCMWGRGFKAASASLYSPQSSVSFSTVRTSSVLTVPPSIIILLAPLFFPSPTSTSSLLGLLQKFSAAAAAAAVPFSLSFSSLDLNSSISPLNSFSSSPDITRLRLPDF